MVLSISARVMLPLLPYFRSPRASSAIATSMTPTVGWSCRAALPLNSVPSRSAQLLTGLPTRSGRMPSVSALVMVGIPVSHSVRAGGEFLAIGPGRVEHGVRRHTLCRGLAAVRIDTLREQRDHLVPVLELADRDRLQHVAADQVFQKDDADVADIDSTRLREKPIQQIGVFGRLHADREAQILARLLGDFRDCGDRRAGMPQGDVLDVLRPDCRETAQRTGADCQSANRGAALQ